MKKWAFMIVVMMVLVANAGICHAAAASAGSPPRTEVAGWMPAPAPPGINNPVQVNLLMIDGSGSMSMAGSVAMRAQSAALLRVSQLPIGTYAIVGTFGDQASIVADRWLLHDYDRRLLRQVVEGIKTRAKKTDVGEIDRLVGEIQLGLRTTFGDKGYILHLSIFSDGIPDNFDPADTRNFDEILGQKTSKSSLGGGLYTFDVTFEYPGSIHAMRDAQVVPVAPATEKKEASAQSSSLPPLSVVVDVHPSAEAKGGQAAPLVVGMLPNKGGKVASTTATLARGSLVSSPVAKNASQVNQVRVSPVKKGHQASPRWLGWIVGAVLALIVGCLVLAGIVWRGRRPPSMVGGNTGPAKMESILGAEIPTMLIVIEHEHLEEPGNGNVQTAVTRPAEEMPITCGVPVSFGSDPSRSTYVIAPNGNGKLGTGPLFSIAVNQEGRIEVHATNPRLLCNDQAIPANGIMVDNNEPFRIRLDRREWEIRPSNGNRPEQKLDQLFASFKSNVLMEKVEANR